MGETLADAERPYMIVVEDLWVRIRVRPETVVTADLVLLVLKDLFSLEAYRSEKQADLWDLRACRAEVKLTAVMRVKSFIDASRDARWDRRSTAIVVDDELLLGLARLHENLIRSTPTEVEVFRTIEQAEGWLRQKAG
jgi:hypothetical protein